MGLETGDFIDDLDLNNPVTATDPVSEGAAHLRLIKKVLLQTLPNYDEALTKTPGELNKAAITTAAEFITGLWQHDDAVQLSNNVPLQAFDFGATAQQMVRVTAANQAQFGSPNLSLSLLASVQQDVLLAGVVTSELNPGAGSGFRVEAKSGGGTLSRVPTVADNQTFNGINEFSNDLTLGNEQALLGRDSGGAPQNLARMIGIVSQFGNATRTTDVLGSTQINQNVGGTNVGRAVSIASGGLLVKDRLGTFKKSAFRNPTTIVNSLDKTPTQDDEGRVFRCTTTQDWFMVDTLEPGTTMRLICTAGGVVSILKNTLNLLRWMDGFGGIKEVNGVLTQAGSVVELYYGDVSTTCYVWGNGLVEIP